MDCDISVFKCHRCFREWDEYESNRKFRLRKCSVCHAEICKTCFYNVENKQHCFKCSYGCPKSDNKCVISKLEYRRTYK